MESKALLSECLVTSDNLNSIAIPYMGDTQFRNNPFRRFSRPGSCGDSLSGGKSVITSKHYANSAYIPSAERPSYEFRTSLTRPKVSPNKHEQDSEEVKHSDSVPYTIKMTREVEQNFSVMKYLRLGSIEEVKFKEVALGTKSKRASDKTLILDLDGTLIYTLDPSLNYSAIDICHEQAKLVLYKDNNNSNEVSIKVLIRPHAIELLKELSKIYEIIVLPLLILGLHRVRAPICQRRTQASRPQRLLHFPQDIQEQMHMQRRTLFERLADI
eukprot:TRINITY_DN2594_c0_g1_i2.p1 TRINITY_DN2594_c0_g1~~TRINITY_DN2594_c0_g1_i2.p1  ORF type:complete len:271 (-),score=18.88 TRINITY_DN2594_c0_g1_i2:311-1123(-)